LTPDALQGWLTRTKTTGAGKKELAPFWTGHSARHWLVTVAAALDYNKEWEILEDIGDFVKGKGLSADRVRRRHESLIDGDTGWALQQTFPMVVLEDLEIPEQRGSDPKDIEEPVAEVADAWCKVCARKLGIDKCEVVQDSSSGSSSSTEVEKAAEDRRAAAERAALAALVSAWESSKQYIEKENTVRAESRVEGGLRPLATTDRAAMRKAFKDNYGHLDEREDPSSEYLASKIDEIESGEVVATPLDEVSSKADSASMGIQSTVDAAGRIKIVKERRKLKLPADTEELRLRLRVEG
ncbi:unnamed protein product, partial [Effrenium voratum]